VTEVSVYCGWMSGFMVLLLSLQRPPGRPSSP
jgi:hypothetical protein